MTDRLTAAPPLRAAIVGPGKVAATHARAIEGVAGLELVAVCGRDNGRTREFAERWGARGFTSLDRMLESESLDLAIVCTPHPQHAQPAIAACQAGVNVLVEKPMAVSLADCDAMIEAAVVEGVRLGVVSQRRWYEPVLRLKAAIDEGRITLPGLATVEVLGWRGPEYYAMDDWRGTWAGEGGGVLVNQAVHQLDLLLWLLGSLVSVSGRWTNLNHHTIEVEDTAVAVLRFADGSLGSVVLSNSQRPGLFARIRIHGANGASVGVQTDGGSSFVAGVTEAVEPPINDLWTVPGEETLLPEWQAEDRARAASIDVMTHYHACQLADFAAAIREGREPRVTGHDGRRTVELIQAIYASEGRPIEIGHKRAAAPGKAG